MSLPTSLLRVLLAKGIDADTILEMSALADAEQAAKDAEREAAEEAKREKRRESNRRRQKAWYDRHVRGGCDNDVISEDNQDNGVSGVKTVREGEQKKVLEPKKNPTGIITSSTPSGSQVSLPSKPRRFDWPEDGFEVFWEAYPRKTDKKKSSVAYNRLRKADSVAHEVVMAGVHRMVASGIADEDTKYVPHATTFLNNERFNDEWPAKGARRERPPPRGGTQDFWANDSIAGNEILNGGRGDKFPFDTEPGSWDRPGDAGGGRSDEPPSQQAGTDTGRFSTLRLVGGGRA
ncbi:hypothetical protein [Methylobacterium komagatae]